MFVPFSCSLLLSRCSLCSPPPPSRYQALGTPPNYYVNVYSPSQSQPYVVVELKAYGAYADGSGYRNAAGEGRAYVQLQPSALEASIRMLVEEWIGNGTAFYHNAVDRGVVPRNDSYPGYFDLVPGVTDTVLWTEPNWNDIGVTVFLDGSDFSYGAGALLALGVAAVVAAFGGSKRLVRKMKKDKLV